MTDPTAKPSDQDRESFAVVGELVMVSTALDFLMDKVLISVLDLGTSLMLPPVVATLDPARKVEILKARARQMPPNQWRKGVLSFCDQVESVFRQRNIACHTAPVLSDGAWLFKPVAAAKMFKHIDLEAKTLAGSSVDDFRAAIKTGEAAFGSGMNLIDNFERANAEKVRRTTKAG